MSDEVVEMHAIINGHVQGVFFRATVCEHAEAVGINGTVRNMPNGTVEIFAQGKKSQLDALIKKVTENPGMGRVDSIDVNFSEPLRNFTSFSVVY